MVIQKYKRLGFQICFYRMLMNNTDEEKMSEYLAWKSKQERMYISKLWMWWKEQVLKFVRVILVYAIVSLQEDNQVNRIEVCPERNKNDIDEKEKWFATSVRLAYLYQWWYHSAEGAQKKPDVKVANMINAKIIVYQTNNDKVVFHTLHELYKVDPGLVMRVCADKLIFQ